MSIERIDTLEDFSALEVVRPPVTYSRHVKEIQAALTKSQFAQFLQLNPEGHRIIMSTAFLDIIDNPNEKDLWLVDNYVKWFSEGGKIEDIANGKALRQLDELIRIMPAMLGRFYADRKTVGAVSLHNTVRVKLKNPKSKVVRISPKLAETMTSDKTESDLSESFDLATVHPLNEGAIEVSTEIAPTDLPVDDQSPVELGSKSIGGMGEESKLTHMAEVDPIAGEIDSFEEKEADDANQVSINIPEPEKRTSYRDMYRMDRDYDWQKDPTVVMPKSAPVEQVRTVLVRQRSYEPRQRVEAIPASLPNLWKLVVDGTPAPIRDVQQAFDAGIGKAITKGTIDQRQADLLKERIFSREDIPMLDDVGRQTLATIGELLDESENNPRSRLHQSFWARKHLRDFVTIQDDGEPCTIGEIADTANEKLRGPNRINQSMISRRIAGAILVVLEEA